MRNGIALGVLLVGACGPSSPQRGGSTSSDDGTSMVDTSSSGAMTIPDLGSDTSAPATSSSSTSGGAAEDLCLHADPSDCPVDCVLARTREVTPGTCDSIEVEFCVTQGQVDDGPPTTFWAWAPTGPAFIVVGGDCGGRVDPGDGWTECSGAEDEPADCACFCQQGYCLGDEDRRALDECGSESPCEDIFHDPGSGPPDPATEQCVFEALRDRVPGVYELGYIDFFSFYVQRVYVMDNGDTYLLEAEYGDAGKMCTSEWGSASRCDLQPSQFFTSCLELVGTEQDCGVTHAEWTTDCTTQAPTCGRD